MTFFSWRQPMTKLLTTVLLLLSVTVVAAQPGTGTDFPPSFKMVTNVDQKKGQVIVLDTVHKPVAVTVERIVVVNGKEEKITETRHQMVSEQRMIAIDMSNSRVITPDGKQLQLDDVWKKMKAKSVIVMSANGDTPAAVYLRA